MLKCCEIVGLRHRVCCFFAVLVFGCDSSGPTTMDGHIVAQQNRAQESSAGLEQSVAALLQLGDPALFLEDYVRDVMPEDPENGAWDRFVRVLHGAVVKYPTVSADVREQIVRSVIAAMLGAGSFDPNRLTQNLGWYTHPANLANCRVYFLNSTGSDDTTLTRHGPVLRDVVRRENLGSTDALIDRIDDGQTAALVHNSDSAQRTTADNWRILMFGTRARVALGFMGKPVSTESDDVEVIHFDCLAGRERFALIRKDPVSERLVWHSSDEKLALPTLADRQVQPTGREQSLQDFCGSCHGGRENPLQAHKNWYDYESWVGLAGGEHHSARLSGQMFNVSADAEVYRYPDEREQIAIDRLFDDPAWTNSRYAKLGSLRDIQRRRAHIHAYNRMSLMNTYIDQMLHDANVLRIVQQIARVLISHPERHTLLNKYIGFSGWPTQGFDKACRDLPIAFEQYCAQDPSGASLGQAWYQHVEKTRFEVINKTGLIRQRSYEKAIESFPPSLTPQLSGLSLEEVKQLDSVENAGRSSFDMFPLTLEGLLSHTFIFRTLGLDTRHWAMTPAIWGETYQFSTGDGWALAGAGITPLLYRWVSAGDGLSTSL